MASTKPVQNSLQGSVFHGDDGVSDNDILIEAGGVSNFDTFMVSVGTGVVDVNVHDGRNWLTAPVSMADLGATTVTPVLEASALRQFCFRGSFEKIRVLQKGATAATGAVLRCLSL